MSIRTSSNRGPLFLATLFALALSAGCGGEATKADAKAKGKQRVLEPVKVNVGESTAAVTRPTIRVTGTLYAMEDVTISAKVAGRIVALSHDLGDRVGPDKPLAQVDRTDYELAVKERQSAIQATLAKLGLNTFPSADLLADDVPTVKRTLVQLKNVSGRYERLKKLFEQTPPLISEQEYADAETEFKVASSAFEVEKANAQALLAEAMTLQAELNLANQRLTDTSIRTPLSLATTAAQDEANPNLSYAVAERLVSVGEYVREGTPLFRLIDDDPVKLRAMVPERYVGMVTKEVKVTVAVQAHAAPFSGTVSRVSPQVDPASRTFTVEVLIPNPDGLLKPGAFASASIILPNEKPAASVPINAVTSFAGIHKVFTIKDGKAFENRVTLGDRDEKTIIITAGLKPGERIILAPPAQLVSGTPLILPAAPAAE